MIYYLTWKILRNNDLDHDNIFIISGTREIFANYIKEKMAKLFERNFPLLNLYTKYTEMVLKNTWIKVFPTTAIKDLRGYFSAKYIIIDKSDFFPESVQQELQHAINPYQVKSNCKIIMASTPNAPNGLMQQIELDKDSKYFKLKLPYSYGLDRIYNKKDVKPKMHDIEFEGNSTANIWGK
jgi:late competence protein required for DNA uptake (superfamily II DNA/RNA helicase)